MSKKEKAKKALESKPETPRAAKPEGLQDYVPEKVDKYRVAKGKSISCRKGIRVAGDPIEAKNVGTQKDLDLLIEKGYVEVY